MTYYGVIPYTCCFNFRTLSPNVYMSQCGLGVSIKILRYFPRSGSPDRFRNFESLRQFWKGRLQSVKAQAR